MKQSNATHDPKPSPYNWLGARVRRFVRLWRRFDAWLNQPLPADRSLLLKCLAPDGYAWFVPVLSGILIAAMALGPTFVLSPVNVLFLATGFSLLLVLHYRASQSQKTNQYLLGGQLFILAVLTLLLIIFSRPESYGGESSAPRLHIGAAITVALVLALTVVWLITKTLFRSDAGGALATSLSSVELFLPKDRYDFMGRGPLAALISAFAISPVRYPVEILLPGALFSLFVPDHYLRLVFVALGSVAWIAIFLAILFDRLMEVLQTVGRLFFIGPQRVISIVVILVAILRLLDVHYITYLFNAGSSGFGNTIIMRYIALAYVVAWFYAFWCDSFVARRLMRLLDGTQNSVTPVSVPYNFAGDPTLSNVENTGRTIALHGAGRIRIQGIYRRSNGRVPAVTALQFMSPSDVLLQFRTQLERLPATQAPAGDLLASIRNLQRSTVVYPVIVGALAFGLIGIPATLAFKLGIQPPELEVRAVHNTDNNLDLSKLLVAETQANGSCPSLSTDAPRIAVVASGGGTRAAIYTASVLRGLADRSLICNVVVVSGVSGGSAALAYFALHETELRLPGVPDPKAWDRYLETMALPFIEYAIDGASDLRIAFGRGRWSRSACDEPHKPYEAVTGLMPARSRLGSILAEAFVCKMGAGTMREPSFGVMLNTAIVGSFPDPANPCTEAVGKSLAERATYCHKYLDGAKAGGRLVLTNLLTPVPPPDDGTAHMQLITINDSDLSVARAAALSANFPPVFSDAAIDQKTPDGQGTRYWVTDGGAVENRGAMTLYYAIRDALRSVSTPKQPRPRLHVVIADVSASNGRYSESFGFGSVLGAGGQLGLGLETELREAIENEYCEHGSQLRVHEVTMPRMFTEGGIGTHWLLPNSLSFTNPADSSKREILSAADVIKIVLGLHSKNPQVFDDSVPAETVNIWAHDPKNSPHDTEWLKLLSELYAENAKAGTNCAHKRLIP